MQFDPVIGIFPRGPFALRFLHPVLAKDTMPGVQHGLDPFGGLHLADGDQRDFGGGAVGPGAGGADAGGDLG